MPKLISLSKPPFCMFNKGLVNVAQGTVHPILELLSLAGQINKSASLHIKGHYHNYTAIV